MTDSPIAFPRTPAPRAVAPADTPANRMRLLELERAALAAENVERLAALLAEASGLAAHIAEGGEAYQVGVREISRRLAGPLGRDALSITGLMQRESTNPGRKP